MDKDYTKFIYEYAAEHNCRITFNEYCALYLKREFELKNEWKASLIRLTVKTSN